MLTWSDGIVVQCSRIPHLEWDGLGVQHQRIDLDRWIRIFQPGHLRLPGHHGVSHAMWEPPRHHYHLQRSCRHLRWTTSPGVICASSKMRVLGIPKPLKSCVFAKAHHALLLLHSSRAVSSADGRNMLVQRRTENLTLLSRVFHVLNRLKYCILYLPVSKCLRFMSHLFKHLGCLNCE